MSRLTEQSSSTILNGGVPLNIQDVWKLLDILPELKMLKKNKNKNKNRERKKEWMKEEKERKNERKREAGWEVLDSKYFLLLVFLILILIIIFGKRIQYIKNHILIILL